MHLKLDIHLTPKNLLSLIGALVVLSLTLITLLVPPEHLPWARWRASVIVLAVIGVTAFVWLTFKQSREDHEREERDQERDRKIAEVVEFARKQRPPEPVALAIQPESKADATVDGQLYRAVVNPKVGVPFEMFKQIYSLQKGVKADDVKVTTDILLEFYAVNKSSSSIYVKDFLLQYQLPGKDATRLTPESDFSLEMLDMKLEYSLEFDGSKEEPLSSVLHMRGQEWKPAQPIEGWLRFTVWENPEFLGGSSSTFTLVILDSLGNEHVISRASTTKRPGAVGYRKVPRSEATL